MDPVKDFFADLRSPDPSIRFSVLSRLEDLAWTETQQSAFRDLLSQEKDPGIKFHMQKVLARFVSPEGSKVSASASEIAIQLQKPDRDEITLALMLESVKKGEAEKVAINLREVVWPRFSTQLLPSVLKFLKKYGSTDDVDAIAALCHHTDPRVLSAAIEALEKLSPDRLKELIVPLLINSNFGIRSRAVRLLYRWDPSEALRHFEAMLFSNSESEKQAALFHSFFFPFKQIESLLLRYISIETDSELIQKAGLVFMANPDRQIPNLLLEARQACTGEKYKLIDSILKGVLQSLYQAKIVNAAPEQMLEMLESHFREKRIRLYVERFSLGLKSGDAETRLKSAIKLCELARHEVKEARDLIDVYLEKERDEGIRQQVRIFLESGRIAAVEQQTQQEQPKKLLDYSLEQRKRIFDSINKDNYAAFMGQIVPVFAQLSLQEQVTVLNAVERAGSSKDTDLVARCLHSDNPELLTAAIDALSVINPEVLHPLLPQLIKHRFDEVKIAAIKVFALFDKKQAIALVEQMLHSIKPVQRRNAIFCLAHFDFHSVSQILLNALKNEADPDNLQQIFSVLKSNADAEVFFKVFVEARSGKSSKKGYYEELYAELARQIVATDAGKTEAMLYAAAEARLEEESRSKSQRAAYQLEKIQKIREHVDHKPVIDADLIKFTIVAYAIGGVMTAMIWFLFLAPPAVAPGGPAKKVPIRQVSSKVTIRGIITGVDEAARQISIGAPGNKQKSYRINVPASFGKMPESGKDYHAQVKVLSERDGVVTAELITAF